MLWGDGTEIRNFVYVEDLVRVVSELITSNSRGVMNVCSADNRSFRDCLNVLKNLIKRELRFISKERSKQKVDSINFSKILPRIRPQFKFSTLEEALAIELKDLYDRKKQHEQEPEGDLH